MKEKNYMGLISWSKSYCNKPQEMFGTEVKTCNPITLCIDTADEDRTLSHNYYHERSNIVKIEMTPVQWAEFLTSGNSQGVPVTLTYVNGKKMDNVENENIVDQFTKESEKSFDSFEESLKSLKETISNKLAEGKVFTKKEMQEMFNKIDTAQRNCGANVDFVKDSFQENMQNIVTKAKAEVSAFCETKALEYGKDFIKNNIITIGDKK